VILLPIHNRHLIDTEHFGHVFLEELEFEAFFAKVIAESGECSRMLRRQGFGSFGSAL
jgi:hypothetical protein